MAASRKASPANRGQLRELLLLLDSKGGKWAAVLTLLGIALQFVPWGCSLLGITVNYHLGLVVMGLSLIALATATWLAWSLSRPVSIMLGCGAIVAVVLLWYGATKTTEPTRMLYVAKVEPFPFVVGERLKANIHIANSSAHTIRIQSIYKIQVGPLSQSPGGNYKQQDDLFESMTKEVNINRAALMEVPPKKSFWVTDMGPRLTQEQLDQIHLGSAAMFFMGKIAYKDSNGRPVELTHCHMKTDAVTILCARHNE